MTWSSWEMLTKRWTSLTHSLWLLLLSPPGNETVRGHRLGWGAGQGGGGDLGGSGERRGLTSGSNQQIKALKLEQPRGQNWLKMRPHNPGTEQRYLFLNFSSPVYQMIQKEDFEGLWNYIQHFSQLQGNKFCDTCYSAITTNIWCKNTLQSVCGWEDVLLWRQICLVSSFRLCFCLNIETFR